MTPSSWQIYFFGGLRIEFNGQAMAPPPFRSQSLLAALSLKPSLKTREQLAGRFFPEFPESTAKARLSDRLWLLKNHLPGFPISTTSKEINLSMEHVWVDVNEFRRLVKKGGAASLTQAASLYAGDLLPEQDEEWILVERENLRLAYTRALQSLASLALKSDEYAEAIEHLGKLQAIEPFDENNLRSLLRAYQSLGQRGPALAAFDRYQAMLKSEMDLEPEPATLEVVQAVRSQVMPRPRPLPEMEPDDSPESLSRRCQPALWRGDFHTVKACLGALRKNPGPVTGDVMDSLEAEWAILRGDYGAAGRLLGKYQDSHSLPVAIQKIHLSVELKNFSDVVERCKAAILEAHREKDTLAETLLLADLGLACQRTGNPTEAMRCANQVITLAEKNGLPYPLARGYHLKGVLLAHQGFERDALETFHHAASHAEEHGFEPLLARVEGMLAANYQNAGKYNTSLQHYAKALQIARDLGLRRDEAENLHNRAIVVTSLGRTKEGILDTIEARNIFAALEDEMGTARNTYHLAFSMAYEEDADYDQILDLAHQALELFQSHQSLGWTASVYGLLAYVHWLKGEPDAAIQACQSAIPIYQQLGESDFIPELYGYIGLALLDKGEPEQAFEYTSRAMDEMMRSELYDIASEIYYAHASALSALGREEEASEYFSRGYENLLEYAKDIEDSEARQAYFRRDPTVRRLMEQVYARRLTAPPQVETHLVSSRSKTPIQVSLTVDAGAPDLALKNASGPVSLRRARLLRILKEARLQGAQPSLRQVAVVMGVSLRTIQRDIARLESRGEMP